jgi:hypothetical protein
VLSDASLFYTDVTSGNKHEACVTICATLQITLQGNNDLMTGKSDAGLCCETSPLHRNSAFQNSEKIKLRTRKSAMTKHACSGFAQQRKLVGI